MPTRSASAEWKGSLKEGSGTIRCASGEMEVPYSFGKRFGDVPGTNPEELVGAAHAGCFSMALAAALGRAGYIPEYIRTTARVHLEKVGEGFAIPRIDLTTRARVPNLDEATFQEQAQSAKENCPVSKLYKGAEITLDAALE